MEKPIVSTSPHIRHRDTTSGIMLDVIIALMPALIAGVAFFGTRALINLTVCVVTAVLAEYLCCLVMKKPSSIGDLSAVVTGLLLGLNLPASLPFWMGALGSAIAVIIIKQMFGGLGQNFVNPAITARIVLMVSFPTAMTTWIAPLTRNLDAVSSPTPMADSSLYSLKDLALGIHPGCIGETCSVLLLAGGVYLIFRKVIRPTIPLCFIGTVGALTLIA
ncbi:MAG: RnfABCDGE type electron transport complex subunit D, partial [Oscillospiraceae bacterium]